MGKSRRGRRCRRRCFQEARPRCRRHCSIRTGRNLMRRSHRPQPGLRKTNRDQRRARRCRRCSQQARPRCRRQRSTRTGRNLPSHWRRPPPGPPMVSLTRRRAPGCHHRCSQEARRRCHSRRQAVVRSPDRLGPGAPDQKRTHASRAVAQERPSRAMAAYQVAATNLRRSHAHRRHLRPSMRR